MEEIKVKLLAPFLLAIATLRLRTQVRLLFTKAKELTLINPKALLYTKKEDLILEL